MKWLVRQNAYTILKLLLVISLIYEFIASILFVCKLSPSWGGYISETWIFYIGLILISYTPPGKLYYSWYFRVCTFILLISRLFNLLARPYLNFQQNYALVAVILFTAAIFFIIGAIVGKQTKISQNEK